MITQAFVESLDSTCYPRNLEQHATRRANFVDSAIFLFALLLLGQNNRSGIASVNSEWDDNQRTIVSRVFCSRRRYQNGTILVPLVEHWMNFASANIGCVL